MSVINTNITSLIAQKNLSSSQSALTTAMERLSSGMRINSAKDDAAGQAIANRMSSQITGLTQAQRNANDGISVAQTTEGALDQINDNLQRIRELTVQAQNGTNSESDKESIQNEISQRLSEIDRISKETSFNGTSVLASDNKLKIQVGAQDGQTIEISLQKTNSSTLGISQFNVSNMLDSTSFSDALSEITLSSPYQNTIAADVQGNTDPDIDVDIQANGVDLTDSEQDSGITALGVYNASGGSNTSGFVVQGSDGKYYDLQENDTTGGYYFDTNAGVSTATSISSSVATTSYVNATTSDTTALTNVTVGADTDFFSADGGKIYRRNDVTDADIAAGTASGYAIKGNDGNYYALDLAASDTDADTVNDAATFSISGGAATPSAWTQVSAGNINDPATGTTDFIVDTDVPPSVTDDLLNIAVAPSAAPTADGLYTIDTSVSASGYAVKGSDGNYYAATVDTTTGEVTWDSSTGALDASSAGATAVTKFNDAPTADGLYALADGSGYAVKGDDGNYYAAVADTATGEVTWDSSLGAIDASTVDTSAAVTEIDTTTDATATVTGLGTGETLLEIQDDEGNGTGEYVVKGQDEYGNTTYHSATVSITGNVATVTKNEDEPLTVDALSQLDSALKNVDALRSDLGAIQNRFESAITNLSTTTTNLSAARSRIEDADYAVEVANMTKAQILQQAGTSVLAQANQIPQSVLSLLG